MTDPAASPRPQDLLAMAVDLRTSVDDDGAWQPPKPEELKGVLPRIEVHRYLGRGAMGAVYQGRQTHLDRTVAVKLLMPALAAKPGLAERFRREALAMARLSHPHIVAVHDVGEANGWHYLVMEFVDGATLRETLRTGRFSPSAALGLIPLLCEALTYAHRQGVVHRDLKPENILLDRDGRPRIADFGLAKLAGDRTRDSLTRSGQMLGTAAYMAPEQMEGAKDVDHRADLYALGVIAYEMLTGQLPLGRFDPPSRRVEVDVRIDEVVLRALERTPDQRWQSAEEVRRAVAAALERRRSPWLRRAGIGLGIAAVLALGFLLGLGAGSAGTQALPSVAADRTGATLPAPETAHSDPPRDPPPRSEAPLSTAMAPAGPAPSVTGDLVPVLPPSSTTPMPALPVSAVPEIASPAVEPSPVGAVADHAAPAPPASTPATVPAMRLLLVGGGRGRVEIHSDPLGPDLGGLERGPDGAPMITAPAHPGMPPVQVRIHPRDLHRITVTAPASVRVLAAGADDLEVNLTGIGSVDVTGVDASWLTLRLTGGGRITAAGTVGTLVVDHAGQRAGLPDMFAGSMDIRGIQAQIAGNPAPEAVDLRALAVRERIDLTLSGDRVVALAGSVPRLAATLTGPGSLAAEALDAEHADIRITGSGDVRLGRLQALDAVCTGTGTLRYRGNPRLGRIITGR